MELKKIIKIVILIFITLIILFLVFLLGAIFYRMNSDHYDSLASFGYYKYESYKSTDSMTFFSKYYYYDDPSEIGDEKYKVSEDKAEIIKDYIGKTMNKLYELDNSINIEFNYDIITVDDSYLIVNNKEFIILNYYDADEHILYEAFFSK